jgi:acyl-CoA thioesterase
MYLFDHDILMEANSECKYEGIVSPNWSINGHPNGGYLTAFLASAMQKKSDKKWPVIVTANFLTKCETGKKTKVAVETISIGKQLNRYQASLIQDGIERTRAWATFMNESNCDESANRYEKDAPEMLPREECVPYPAMPKYTLFDHMDIMLVPSCAGWLQRTGDLSPISEQKGWIKFKDGRPCDALSLLLLADSFAPPVLASHGAAAWVPTIEYSVSVRALPDTAWLKGIFRSHYLTCDIVEEDGELWDENGKLLAISRQIAQFRKF